MQNNIIEELKALPFTLSLEYDAEGVLAQTLEFPQAFEYATTENESVELLAQSMKEWGVALGTEIDRWKNGRENELPYLLKILVSSEEELLSCLKKAKSVNI